jgi:hypothetical protein
MSNQSLLRAAVRERALAGAALQTMRAASQRVLDNQECRTCGERARLCHCLINGRTPVWKEVP